VTKPAGDDPREKAKQRHAVTRSVHLYALLIAALLVINVLMYWQRGTFLSLVVAIVAAIALAGYLFYARKVLRSL
jgi:predicted RND superfamily exporter protein